MSEAPSLTIPRAVTRPSSNRFAIGQSKLHFSLAMLLLTACTSDPQSPQDSSAAKALFEQTTKTLHNPSAEAVGAERVRLQNEAAAAYQQLIKKYPKQDAWAAPALRSLGSIRAAQSNLNEAIRCYADVEKKYPGQEWEVLMSWKTAADLLWEAGRHGEAKLYYQKIVTRFDATNAVQVVKTIVRGSKTRLTQTEAAPEK